MVYVDDVLIKGSNIMLVRGLKKHLDDAFTIKDLDQAKYFLGFEILRTSAGICLCQKKYITNILSNTGMLECKAAPSPRPHWFHL